MPSLCNLAAMRGSDTAPAPAARVCTLAEKEANFNRKFDAACLRRSSWLVSLKAVLAVGYWW